MQASKYSMIIGPFCESNVHCSGLISVFFPLCCARVMPVLLPFSMTPFSLNVPFCLKMYSTLRGSESWTRKWLYFVLLDSVRCCSSVSHPPFERACYVRQPDIGSESFFCATYYANNQ